jgi:putative hemolysin
MIIFELLICLLAAAFFAGLETGLLSADQLSLYLKKEKKVFYARAADYLLLKPERLLSTTLIGTNIAVVSAAVMLSSYLHRLDLRWGTWLGSLGLSLLLLVFAEIVPKSFFRRHADTVSVRFAPVLTGFYFLFLPLGAVLNTLVRVFSFRSPVQKRKLPESRDDLRLLVRLGTRVYGLDKSEARVFEDIFDFRDTMAREVMVPIHRYPVCASDAGSRELVDVSRRHGLRFIPVYRDRADNIVGYVDMDELLRSEKPLAETDAADLTHKAIFYPDTKKVPMLLLEMNSRRLDLVFLSDEYGAVSGLLTPADIAAEIVGFIPGAQLSGPAMVQRLVDGAFLIPGTMDIEDLAHDTGVIIRRGQYDTLGGFLCERLGRIPDVGDRYEENNILYEIIDRDERSIKTVKLSKKAPHAHKKP